MNEEPEALGPVLCEWCNAAEPVFFDLHGLSCESCWNRWTLDRGKAMTPETLAEIEQYANEASCDQLIIVSRSSTEEDDYPAFGNEADASFWGRARSDILALCARVRELEAELEELRGPGMLATFLEWRDIKKVCGGTSGCGGTGRKCYGSGSTWHGGTSGQVATEDICDRCWGSGDVDRPGANLRLVAHQAHASQVSQTKIEMLKCEIEALKIVLFEARTTK